MNKNKHPKIATEFDFLKIITIQNITIIAILDQLNEHKMFPNKYVRQLISEYNNDIKAFMEGKWTKTK